MDLPWTDLARHGHGVLLTSHAAQLGITKAQLQWAVHTGRLIRVARGAYAPREQWTGASARQRHLVRLRAAQALSPRGVAVAESAAVVWGLPLPEIPELPRLALPRDRPGTGGSGTRPHAVGRLIWLDPEERSHDVDGIRVTSPARTILDCARHLDRPWSLAVADAAYRHQQVSGDQVRAVAQRHPHDPGHATACWVADHVVNLAESPLESLARAVVILAGLPAPRPQVWLELPGGGLARVDLLDPSGGVVIEADGRLKYTDADALWQEKLREDAVRGTGREVVRFTYRDYRHPRPWLALYATALARAARTRAPAPGTALILPDPVTLRRLGR